MQAPLQAGHDSDTVEAAAAEALSRQRDRADSAPAAAIQARTVVDNRPGTVAQRQLAETMDNAPRVLQRRALSEAIHASPRMTAPAQRAPLPNRTGMPDRLKSGIEALSGLRMDHVRVHYNSDRPGQLRAHAYAHGSEIHVGPGQERHLPHEAWHVVQQAQGRVRPTVQLHDGVAVNNEQGLEQEATVMGARALGMSPDCAPAAVLQDAPAGAAVIFQRWPPDNEEDAEAEAAGIIAALQGQGIVLEWEIGGRQRSLAIDGMKAATLVLCLGNAGLSADPGTSGQDPAAIIAQLRHWDALRKWVAKSRAQGRGFGFGNVDTVGFPAPSPFQQSYGLNPHAPELHGQPLGSAPQGSTYEQLGSFDVIRRKPPEQLARQRETSRAYRSVPKKVGTHAKPPFAPDVYSGESTLLGPKRVALWKQEKRGETANRGPFKGKKWPDQQSQLGRVSAQEAVASHNAVSSTKLDPALPYEWLHLFAFSMGGQDNLNPQDPRNFVVGTQFANYYHLAWETAAKELAATHSVLIKAEPMDVVDADWRIYRTIRYTITLVQVHPGTFARPEPFLAPRKTVTEDISCLDTPQVHARDPQMLKDWILLALGVPTEAYQKAVAGILDSGQPGHHGPLSGFEGGYGAEMEEEDIDFHTALVNSVQEIAAAHGVLGPFAVGHADGRDDNCSLLSAFEAAGAPISRQQAQAYRAELHRSQGIPLTGKLDLAQHRIANAVLGLIRARVGDREIVVIHPQRQGEHTLTTVAGSGERIFLFYASGHFSPARLHGS